MRSTSIFILAILCISITPTIAQSLKAPSFEEVLSLKSVGNAEISPDGKNIVFQSTAVDWKENRYDTELWISKNGGTPFPLTNNLKNSSSNAKWSPDGEWIAFMSDRGDKNQIHVVRVAGGESFQVTNTDNSITNFDWSPDGKQIAFVQPEDKSKEEKKRKEKFGGFEIEDEEFHLNQLWIIDFNANELTQHLLPDQLKDTVLTKKMKAQQLMANAKFSINSFIWSPDGKKIAFTHQPDPLQNTFFKADISIYDVTTKAHQVLVNNPSFDAVVDWSPDGKSILYQTHLSDSLSNYYKNGHLFSVNIDGSGTKKLAADFDENLSGLEWNLNGIFATAWQKTNRPMVRIDPKSGTVTVLSTYPKRVYGFTFSRDGKAIAFTGVNDLDLTEVYTSAYPLATPKKITNESDQIVNWMVSASEVIAWPSEDGTIIEGILHKPKNYDPKKKYPLLVVIHGGPTGISTPSATPSYVYPILQWLNKGALVLMPNYRGSAGYGEKFRSLNVENLGVGDAWDVLSGVKYLEEKGIIDGDKVGSMGWSQGGYISAFLTTNANKFKAISVGAGISNWMTYYVNTDIHPFTRQYLKSTPWSDKAMYEKTSPMTNINNASTPTLIQHGEFDTRVPPANAYELFQGLQDMGVETKLVIYKGFGHGITKPKERLAATWHNWQWFGKYIWGEEIVIPEK